MILFLLGNAAHYSQMCPICKIYTPYAGLTDILLSIKGKSTMFKLKLSRKYLSNTITLSKTYFDGCAIQEIHVGHYF